ncbi:MAG: SDR family oxidoreductase [Ignavibacteria bacterium]|nr:SDR family oxidoreductase [Ignavibacteria bacterium]
MKKTALITGASGGIGFEMARIFAKNNTNLILVARNKNKLDELKNELENQFGVSVYTIGKDLSSRESARELYEETKKQNIPVEYLINNAGFGDFGMFTDTDWDKEERMINLNIKTLTLLTKLCIRDMAERGSGKIMNVASTAAFQPGPLMAVYCSTKSYVLNFSQAINNEVKSRGVTVTALCPGPTESGFQDASGMKESKIVTKLKMPSSKTVAEYGYKAMMKGKPVAIHGFINRMLALSVRFMPRNVVVKVTRILLDK